LAKNIDICGIELDVSEIKDNGNESGEAEFTVTKKIQREMRLYQSCGIIEKFTDGQDFYIRMITAVISILTNIFIYFIFLPVGILHGVKLAECVRF